jgi:fructosamine-3-kinase
MKDRVSKLLQTDIKNCRLISSNSISKIYGCDDRFVVKISTNKKHLEIEKKMLEYLRENSPLLVPKVYLHEKDMLISEFIPSCNGCRDDFEEDIAYKLASLHRIRGESFGFEYDTTIGVFDQPNTKESSWIEFYRQKRVLHFARGILPQNLHERVETLCENFEDLLIEPSYPSLIHGDIWSGNIIRRSSQETYFIDPAIYFADREIELSFIMMFNTFGERFFKKYDKLYKIEEGFFDRRYKIYQLYPYLVHAKAFGGSYIDGVERIVSELGF